MGPRAPAGETVPEIFRTTEHIIYSAVASSCFSFFFLSKCMYGRSSSGDVHLWRYRGRLHQHRRKLSVLNPAAVVTVRILHHLLELVLVDLIAEVGND